MRATWLFYHLLKLEVHILHGLENISIFNIWKLWLVRYDVIFAEMSLIQVIPGNLQKSVSANRSQLQCKTLPAHFSNNMIVYCLLNVI